MIWIWILISISISIYIYTVVYHAVAPEFYSTLSYNTHMLIAQKIPISCNGMSLGLALHPPRGFPLDSPFEYHYWLSEGVGMRVLAYLSLSIFPFRGGEGAWRSTISLSILPVHWLIHPLIFQKIKDFWILIGFSIWPPLHSMGLHHWYFHQNILYLTKGPTPDSQDCQMILIKLPWLRAPMETSMVFSEWGGA